MKKALAFTICTLLLLIMIPAVEGSNDSVKVILCVDGGGADGKYQVGESVTVDVFVLDKGLLADADDTPNVVLNPHDMDNKRNITVNRIAAGTYSGSFTILESDVSEGTELSIRATATMGKENASDTSYDEDSMTSYITVVTGESAEELLSVGIVFDDSNSALVKASPGQNLQMTVTVKYKGILANPEALDIKEVATGEIIVHTNPAIGVFKANYTVSSELTNSKTININVSVEHMGESKDMNAAIYVDFYYVWLHVSSVTATKSEFEIYTADSDGKVISGASVDVRYRFDEDYESVLLSETTDSSGKASFSVTYESAESIYLDGTVTYQGKVQKVSSSIDVSDGEAQVRIEEPNEYDDFEVIYQENAGVLKAKTTVTLEYIAYDKAVKVPNQKIYYYIYSATDFIKSGLANSDSNAKFSFSFDIPEKTASLKIDFESPFESQYVGSYRDSDDGLNYRTDSDYHYISGGIEPYKEDNSLKIETSELKIGGETTITISKTNSQDFYGNCLVIPGKYSLFDQTSTQQPKWMPMSILGYMQIYMPENGKVSKKLLLPEFLPKDGTYTVIVWLVDTNSEFYDIYWNTLEVKPGNKASSDDADDNPNPLLDPVLSPLGINLPCYALLIILVLILIVIIVAVKRRGGKASAQPPYPQENEIARPPPGQNPPPEMGPPT